MDYLPIFVKLKGRPCLVVGGGEVAWRKTRMLMKAGAEVTVVAPDADDDVVDAADRCELVWQKEVFTKRHLNTMFLVIAATNNPLVNQLIFQAADARHILVNVVDDTPKCSFILPSIIDRCPVVIALSSSGKAPVLTRLLREKLETLIPSHIGRMAVLAGEFRNTLRKKLTTLIRRRKFWEMAFNGRFNSLVAAGNEQGAKDELEKLTSSVPSEGEVALIGAGPGAPSLLTLRALQLMQQADVVLYDYLVSDEIIELCRRDARLICVGKRAYCHSISQKKTNALLVKYAQEGKRVVRLKGGDPFMFGRGGEELQVLKEAGVSFQVVPGITAAAGSTAYAGIPLTHREHAQTAMFITGHLRKENDNFRWATMARCRQTLVIYMGLMKSGYIQQKLIHHGRDPLTPIAIIENGTRTNQKIFKGILSDLESLAGGVSSPALIIVGEVVQLADQLSWFGQRALNTASDLYAPSVVNLG
ncbi:siroheme synthase CysG [Candidatus Enterovibrio escicola]|uniref:Siroheme synthase n=1 Tax=Candidatus Enterovibrio escicola TaxID=1927127 RepID=A0A2A5T1W4_9GAMM|nr:siroheme synthase CysG [Candidatus Enterovibrio escacola]PCS22136.1 Uroporphyrinogen-III methyltransferase [Candidatus Enterovibrio escacola]